MLALVQKKYISAFFMVLIVIILSIGKDSIQVNRQGDAAIFEQLIDNIYVGKGAVSNVFANTQDYIEHTYFTIPPAELIVLSPPLPAQKERDMLKFHAYYILYPLAFLKLFFTSSFALILMQMSAFFLTLVISYRYVANRATSIVAIIFAAFVWLNPNWFAGLMGQFYPDRLFVGVGCLLCYFLHTRIQLRYLLPLLLVVAALNERAAAIGGVVVLAYNLLFFDAKDVKRAFVLGAASLFMLLYFWIQQKFVLDNFYYSSFLPNSMAGVKANLAYPGFVDGILTNIKNNAPLLFFALFAPRWMLIALGVMLPNILGNIGGAEKVGWLTHYHSYYFPILVFAAAVGFVSLFDYVKIVTGRYTEKFSPVYWLLPILFAVFASQHIYLLNNQNIRPFAGVKEYKRSFVDFAEGRQSGYDLATILKSSVGSQDTLSTTEMGMALMHENVNVTYFPVGLNVATKIFIPCAQLEEKFKDKRLVDFLYSLGFSENIKVNQTVSPATSYCFLEKSKI